MHTNVQAAREFALRAHGSQQYGEHPYSYHLDAVAALLEPFGDQAQVAAYLHDTVEDTSATNEEIEASFGQPMAETVALLTDEEGDTRSARKAKTNAKLAATNNTLALTVKAADRLANLLECQRGSCGKLEMYRREHEAFRKAAYRDGLSEDLWQRIDAIIAGE
ncbi:HD domain-containing protein [Rosistilla oblonga]|uniref:GTP pyrophosphokinase rsh n=1 Tax=Rosistilla oblonga TaxID=2527990 RepID=A0A518J0R1_9BACT|nr:HD domain-containing protein [Rosistilla oblonga]QDV58931.1 GTP pyrophosphokinase rsh [Rosistilla oblonga]